MSVEQCCRIAIKFLQEYLHFAGIIIGDFIDMFET